MTLPWFDGGTLSGAGPWYHRGGTVAAAWGWGKPP